MANYSWRNIAWDKNYNNKWYYNGQTTSIEECFLNIFNIQFQLEGWNTAHFYAGKDDNGIPYIEIQNGRTIILTLPYEADKIRFRKSGSDNNGMIEVDVENKVAKINTPGAITIWFGEIAIGISGYMWITNSKPQTLNNFWYWCDKEVNKYTTTEHDATTKYQDNIYVTHPINFLINNQSILGVRSSTPIQGTVKPNSQPTNWGFSAGWKYRVFDGQVIEKPSLDPSFQMKTGLQIYDTLESFAFADKNKPIVVADNFASASFYVGISSTYNYVYYDDDFTIPLDVENYDVYLIARKSTTELIKGLKEIKEWDNKNQFAPKESGYYIDPNSVFGSVRVGVWITEDTTIQTETTSELLYYKLDGYNYILESATNGIDMLDSSGGQFISMDNFKPVEGSSEENKIYSMFTQPTSFTYVFEDILDPAYARIGGGNQGIIMVRNNYHYYDDEYPSTKPYNLKVNWELAIKNFTTLSDYRNITSYLNKDIYIKQNCVNIVTSAGYNNRTPSRIMVSSLWSGVCLKTFLNLLPKYINFLENSEITHVNNYAVGDWYFFMAWEEQILQEGLYMISHTAPCANITVTSSDKGSTWAKFGQLSFGAYVNDFKLLDTSGRWWELSKNDTCYAFAVVLMPKEFNPSDVEQLEPTLPEGASLT